MDVRLLPTLLGVVGTACFAGPSWGASAVAHPNPTDEPFAHTVTEALGGSDPDTRDPVPSRAERGVDAALRSAVANADEASALDPGMLPSIGGEAELASCRRPHLGRVAARLEPATLEPPRLRLRIGEALGDCSTRYD